MTSIYAAYQELVDQLVHMSRTDPIAVRLRKTGHSERTNYDDLPLDEQEIKRKAIFLSLTPEQRDLMTKVIEEVRMNAIFDIASFLEWGLSCEHMTISWKGKAIPASPYDTMHCDFLMRFEGHDWPDDSDARWTT
jgi:hypothetical protein